MSLHLVRIELVPVTKNASHKFLGFLIRGNAAIFPYRSFSLLLVGEWIDHDDFEETRALAGLTFRF